MTEHAREDQDNVQDAEDAHALERLGYAQELLRRMGAFSNFAISFSIICILAGGITSFQLGLCSVGGASIGIGWPLSATFSMLCALAMGQVASAFPTAGGLYHWASILGSRGWGWLTAWLNLLGLVTVLAAINVGTYLFVMGSVGHAVGVSEPTIARWQLLGVALITGTQALFNHLGIRTTALLTDMSGYLILIVSSALTGAVLWNAPAWEISRLWTFTNYSGAPGGGVWPETSSLGYLFLLGLLLPAYTITGFDASAHTAEETTDATNNVPKGMVSAVLWSGLFGWLMLCSLVISTPDLDAAAATGPRAFFTIFEGLVADPLRLILYAGISLAQYLCGLAALTSTSRMVYAFARDGGLPWSGVLRVVHPNLRTPVAAIWVSAVLTVSFTVYANVYATITSVCVIFLYVSYLVPIALGLWAHGRTWTQMGPWNLGAAFKPIALACVMGCLVLLYLTFQDVKAFKFTVASLIVAGVVWFTVERRRFHGPPVSLSELQTQPQERR
jgi:amino acid transporter